MAYRVLADLTVGVHIFFILYVVGGALLTSRARWLAIPHLACVVWGLYVELAPDAVCPLTPLENRLSTLAGQAGYPESFIEHYLLPALYPDNLTREFQWVLAGLVVLTNVLIYGVGLRRPGRRQDGRRT